MQGICVFLEIIFLVSYLQSFEVRKKWGDGHLRVWSGLGVGGVKLWVYEKSVFQMPSKDNNP